LVAKGYDQIAGVDFQYNFAPVINDITVRVLLVIWLVNGFDARVIDVKTAFLHGNLEEDIFIKLPEGYKEFIRDKYDKNTEEKHLKLEKSLYGLVQAAREWWKKFVKSLKQIGFQDFPNDNCVLSQNDEHGFCAIGIYVDDCLLIGNKEAIDHAIEEIKGMFDITTSEVKDFVGCTIKKDNHTLTIHQPDIIRRMYESFKPELEKTRDLQTPAGPGFKVVRPKENDKTLSNVAQRKY